MTIHSFAFPTPIKFGPGARKLVAQHLIDQGLQRPLIVTDRALAALPVLAEFVGHLNGLVVGVYSGVHGNPSCSQVMEGAEAFRAHDADCVIGFGGGAALDVAKVVGIPATHPGDILEYAWDHPQVRPIHQPLPYFVALPTTSGTGSEVGRSSVVSENDTHLKRVVFSAHILARAVFADPELTLGLPPAVTAATGMDALTHNIESYLSPAYHPLCDGIALEGVRIAAAALRTAVHEPGTLQARTIDAAVLPYFIALPTTAGTGSEVGRSSVISEEATHVKRVIFSPAILAKVVFADPELTLGLPPAVTAATGMDALTHNIESYLSPAYHPLCDGIALEGVRIAARSLLNAVRDGSDLTARADMMMSSMMGAIAFQKDLGAVHSCAHALGTVCDLHHGLANALMIEPVMSYNREAVPHKFAELAHAVGVSSVSGFVPWLAHLKYRIGIPPGLALVGVKREHFPRLVEVATADICHQTNPRPCEAADFARFFDEAY